MNKLLYTNEKGNLNIVHPNIKEKIEEILGPLTDEEYYNHVVEKSIPKGIKYREVEQKDIPENRWFRNAWCDDLPGSQIDIHHGKAKDRQLERLREIRDQKLKDTDGLMMKALESNDQTTIAELKAKRQALRDATDPLKNLQVDGYNDESVLQQIKDLGNLKE